MEKYNNGELDAISTAWEMPAYTEEDQLKREHAIADLKYWMFNRDRFETGEFEGAVW